MLAGHTTALDASRFMDTNDHNQSQPSQQKPASSQQSRTCWTFASAWKASAAICCDCDLSKPATQETKKDFLSSEKNELSWKQKK